MMSSYYYIIISLIENDDIPQLIRENGRTDLGSIP
jgi:hypothetical protein